MSVPSDRRYSETHEWFMPEGDVVIVGISQYAADELTDITYVELPEVGSRVESGSAIGEVESVKATSELMSAVSGEVVEVNGELGDRPELINEDGIRRGLDRQDQARLRQRPRCPARRRGIRQGARSLIPAQIAANGTPRRRADNARRRGVLRCAP